MEQGTDLSSLITRYAAEIGICLTFQQSEQFVAYLDQLQIWNRSTNLTSITDEEEIIVKHFVDSLAGLRAEEIKHGAKILDVGTGAGFPGIPLKIVRPDLGLTLIEPAQKKISFLHSIVGLLRLESVRIFYGTLERFILEKNRCKSFDYVTTRALNYDFVLKQSSTLLTEEGKVILYLSKPITRSELGKEWSVLNEFIFDLPKSLGRRTVCVLTGSQA